MSKELTEAKIRYDNSAELFERARKIYQSDLDAYIALRDTERSGAGRLNCNCPNGSYGKKHRPECVLTDSQANPGVKHG